MRWLALALVTGCSTAPILTVASVRADSPAEARGGVDVILARGPFALGAAARSDSGWAGKRGEAAIWTRFNVLGVWDINGVMYARVDADGCELTLASADPGETAPSADADVLAGDFGFRCSPRVSCRIVAAELLEVR